MIAYILLPSDLRQTRARIKPRLMRLGRNAKTAP
jgi:hypothetical protein